MHSFQVLMQPFSRVANSLLNTCADFTLCGLASFISADMLPHSFVLEISKLAFCQHNCYRLHSQSLSVLSQELQLD